MSEAFRRRQIDAFLAAQGWAGAARDPLPGDASFRRYIRLRRAKDRALLMDAPLEREDVRPYLRVAERLCAYGFSAPRIMAADAQAGLALIEDFGDDTYTRLLARGADEEELYRLAIDVLAALHRLPVDPLTHDIPPYDDGRLLAEAELLIDWYLPDMTGAPASPAARGEYADLWRGLIAAARRVPQTLVLRDYHVDNLMRLSGRAGIDACGLLDFQDAVRGPATYDVVSLLEDARRDISRPLISAMCARYLAAVPGLDERSFAVSYAILGAHRHAKVIGIFTRLLRRDGKSQYLQHIPRVWRLLESHLDRPDLAPLKAWLDRYLPPPLRRVPELRAA